MIDHTSYKAFHFLDYFTHRNVNSQFKTNLCEKAKADTLTPDSRQGGTFIYNRNGRAVFTLETDYLSEIGYSFDDSDRE